MQEEATSGPFIPIAGHGERIKQEGKNGTSAKALSGADAVAHQGSAYAADVSTGYLHSKDTPARHKRT